MYGSMVPERNSMLALHKMRELALMEEIHRKRLLQEAGFVSVSLVGRVLLILGNLLFTTGKKLREHYTPVRLDQRASTSANIHLDSVSYMGQASIAVCEPLSVSHENRSMIETPTGVAAWIEISDGC